MRRHVVQFSGGAGSWAAARIVRDHWMAPADEMVLLFADTLIEDDDTYAFLRAAADNIGVPLTVITQGETPWELFKRQRLLGNARLDPCSKYLKRVPLRKWIEANCDPATTTIYLGIDYTEAHRLDRAVPRWAPWRVAAPLIAAHIDKTRALQMAAQHGLPEQRLYQMGMPHANCGGGCVKAGIGHFSRLLEVFPERYAEWEANEADVRAHLGKDVAILRTRAGAVSTPLTLTALRERLEAGPALPLDEALDIGGCGCALD